jgi:YHS domain-containing protein
MKYFLLILVFFISSCRPPEPGTDEWFKEKHKELLKADPEVNLSLEEFKDIFSSYLTEEVSDESLMEKHSIGFWLMEEDLLLSSENAKSMAPVYIRILKQCAANFSVMYANMEAGLQYGQAISGLDDVNEMSRLSDEYKDHAYYFATRASEIHFKQTNKAAEISISDEITSIQDEINRINSDKKFLELLDANAEICEMVRNQNPNNKDYIFD